MRKTTRLKRSKLACLSSQANGTYCARVKPQWKAQRTTVQRALPGASTTTTSPPPSCRRSSKTCAEPATRERRKPSVAATTSNKQLNFLQHIRSLLKTTGRATVVLPDNVLFEGGTGETVRKKLMETCDLHTIFRLPTAIFYAQGIKANVLFFDNRPAGKATATKEIWYYDYRTNIHHTLKRSPLRLDDLRDFITCYNPANSHQRKESWHSDKSPDGRWRKFTFAELAARAKNSLDLFWLKDDSLADLDNLPEPADLAEEIIDNIEAGLANYRTVVAALSSPLPAA